ncbi:MAG: SufD family Fe-S cluster assembly protein [Gammaproteobacteria bacterium]
MSTTASQILMPSAQSLSQLSAAIEAEEKALKSSTDDTQSVSHWIRSRHHALQRLAEQGLPNAQRNERWKYSPLQRFWQPDFWSVSPTVSTATASTAIDTSVDRSTPTEAHWRSPSDSHFSSLEMAMIDGQLDANSPILQSHTPGLDIRPLTAITGPDREYLLQYSETELATLCQQDGLCAATVARSSVPTVITIGAGFDPNQILHITHHRHAQQAPVFTLLIVRVQSQQQLTLVEQSIGHTPNPNLHVALCLADLANGAQLNHLRLILGSNTTHQTTYTRVNQHSNSHYHGACYSFGSGFVRAVTEPQLIGSGAHAQVNGGFMAYDHAHHDHRIFVDHRVPHCTSDALYRGIAGRSANAVFNGRIHIAAGAKQSNGSLQNRNVLLDNSATINTKPELEIYNDDVKCSHGATISQLDPQHILYLRSRGLSQAAAINMLLESFLLAPLASLPAVFSATENGLHHWLARQLRHIVPLNAEGHL